MSAVRPRPPGSAFAATVRLIDQCAGPTIGNRGGRDGAAALEAFTGRARSGIYKWTDPEQSEGMPFNLLCQVTAHFRATAAAEHLALRAGGVFVPMPDLDGPAPWTSACGDAAQNFGAAMADIMRALAPDSEAGAALSARERGAIIASIDHALSDLTRLRALAMESGDGDGEGRG